MENPTKVTFDISLSLDGFMTAANRRPEEPLGDGGQRLHEWAFGGDERDRLVLAEGSSATGAVICGRRTYDDSLPWWGADGPTGAARVPVFVVTHAEPDEPLEGGVYTFVTDGIERALEEAKAAAGDKNVTVMGGAQTGQQYLRAGLIDELSIHIVPVVFGRGTRMFDDLGSEHIQLEPIEALQTNAATHLRYRVVR
jgi:dihydrofolate reductase